MKTTNIFWFSSKTIFCLGLLMSVIVLSLPSCEEEVFEIYPDPAEYDSLTVNTTNGKFSQFTIDSAYKADIVVGISDKKDTIRFVKGLNNLTYYFIAPSNLPVGTHRVRINALRTLLSIKVDTLTSLGTQTADAIFSNYLRDEVTPNVNYFSPATPTVASQLTRLRDTTRFLFNSLGTDQKKNIAISILANKNLFQGFNTALRNLRSVPVNTTGPSAVCTGTDFKTYYPCLFETLGSTYTSMEAHGQLLIAFVRALNGSFFFINSAGEYRLNLLANPALVTGLVQFINLLPKGMIMGDIADKANNRTWIVEADFSQIANPSMFTHGVTDTIPVKLSYRNIRSTDVGSSSLVGNYVSRFNAFRSWWNNSVLSFFPAIPALSPQSNSLTLNNLSVVADLSISNANVTRFNTPPFLVEEGFRTQFRTNAETTQTTTINLMISHQGFSFTHSFSATVKPL